MTPYHYKLGVGKDREHRGRGVRANSVVGSAWVPPKQANNNNHHKSPKRARDEGRLAGVGCRPWVDVVLPTDPLALVPDPARERRHSAPGLAGRSRLTRVPPCPPQRAPPPPNT